MQSAFRWPIPVSWACMVMAVATGPAAAASARPSALPGHAEATPALGPVRSPRFHTTLVNLGTSRFTGLLYEPSDTGPKARIALVYTGRVSLFNFTPAGEMASRGYRVMLVKHYLGSRTDEREAITDGVAETSAAIAWLRAMPGVERVVIIGHDGAARLITFYANAAANGAIVCRSADVLAPCKSAGLDAIAKVDGIALLDPDLGPVGVAAIDPAFSGDRRDRRNLDMFAPANGYDRKTGKANYPAAFAARYYAAQSRRNMALIAKAQAQERLIAAGKGDFTDDAPLTVPGALNSGRSASLDAADTSLLSRTKHPQTLLRPDGSRVVVTVRSVRRAAGKAPTGLLASCCEGIDYSLRRFLGNDAIRTGDDFAFTQNDILGVDWSSSTSSVPGNAGGVHIPAMVLAMSCSDRIVPSEIIYDHLASGDKSYVAIEGASHDFAACASRYGDTVKTTFDALDSWLSQPGRF